MNAILEQYLRAFVNYLQDDWEAWLHLAGFTGNNQASETTGMSPLFANYGQGPLWQFDLARATHSKQPEEWKQLEERQAAELASKFKESTEHLQTELTRAQTVHQEQADRKRVPAPALKVGDQVWFNAKNLSTQRLSRELDHRRLGHYKIAKVVSPARRSTKSISLPL